MAGEIVLDTGAVVSVLDRRQRFHDACAEFFRTSEARIVTTEAVLTESTYLLSSVPGGVSTCLDFVLRSGIVVVPSSETSLRRCRLLIDKYSDLPMDFTDSTLVVLAEELNTDIVFTVDQDFTVYRIRGRKPFRIVPSV